MKTAEEIKNTLAGYIAENEKKIALWNQVKRVYKKDGTAFANLGKNFTGCKLQAVSYSSDPDEKELVVSDWSPAGGYVHDEINTRQIVRYSNIKPAEDRIHNAKYLEPWFYLTADEVEQEIKNRIDKLTALNADYKRQYDQADEVFSRFKYAIDNALQELKDKAGANSSLYYEARDYMKRAY